MPTPRPTNNDSILYVMWCVNSATEAEFEDSVAGIPPQIAEQLRELRNELREKRHGEN